MKTAAGFSLIEALVTLLVLSLGLLSLGQLQARLWRSGGDLYAARMALLLAADRTENTHLDALPRESAAPPLPDSGPYRLEVVRAPLPVPLSALIATQVTLHWQRPSGDQTVTLTATSDTAARPDDLRWLLPPP